MQYSNTCITISDIYLIILDVGWFTVVEGKKSLIKTVLILLVVF